jgi:succinyl-diaminopimelate desuccinylase
MSSLVDTLVELIDIPSVTGSEGRIATHIAGRLLPVWTLQATNRIGNCLVVGERTGRPLLALYGHLDTVPEQDNGKAVVDDGVVRGLGASDMKGGLAVMVHLLEDEEVRSGQYDVVGVFYDKEEGPHAENGLEGVLDHAEWLHQAALSIVMEPTDLALELGCNGVLNASLVFNGHAAHSARPWLGENAVTKAGEWLAEIHRREPMPVEIDGLEYREVFTVTRAEGGIANNVIPGEFRVNLNHRFPPVYTIEEAEARLRSVAADADSIEIVDRASAGTVPEDNPYLVRLEELVGGNRQAKQGWTDVARLTSRGIPAVNYGPGLVAQAHRAGEYVPIENLERSFQVLRSLFLS